MALNFRHTTYSFKRLSQDEVATIRPLRIRFKTVLEGDSVETLSRRMPIENFALEWFKILNKTGRNIPLKPGQQVRIISR
jgi:predicted Zn-dependent protease